MVHRNLLNTAEAAAAIGVKKSYLAKLMMNKAITYYKPNGKLCFFDPEDLDKWMRRNRITSDEELEQIAHKSLLKM